MGVIGLDIESYDIRLGYTCLIPLVLASAFKLHFLLSSELKIHQISKSPAKKFKLHARTFQGACAEFKLKRVHIEVVFLISLMRKRADVDFDNMTGELVRLGIQDSEGKELLYQRYRCLR